MKVLEQIPISPAPNSVSDKSVLLTFLDMFWYWVPPVQRLFFYQYPHPTTHFLNTHLPNIKHSLSLSLQLFYPLAGQLSLSLQTGNQEIRYINGDSVPLTIAESNADFHRLTLNLARNVTEFHHLVPHLPTYDIEKTPILALQVTIFPNSGICIGMSIHHGAADGSTSTHFMKSWASIFKVGGDLSHQNSQEGQMEKKNKDVDIVLATFVLTRVDLEKLRQWVMARVEPNWKPYYSSFVLTCVYVWICLLKVGKVVGDKRVNFIFAMDFRARLDPPLPSTYVGNCIGICFAEANARDFGGENGLVVGSEVIRRAIRETEDGVLKGAEHWARKYLSLLGESLVMVAGSPKFRMYEIDFGWGRPKKVEVISIENAVSLAESRDKEGGIEIGLALPKHEMLHFTSL
ncbi:malonyl-coenzyme A:anthocyanin 3-O-glucoside-6''-O-malonyltransferase-like [Tasmannia lanceolata]|uniref:malonyl-coenzyme A:anthocyanin 3-O-glucoside-6''-O-malonyltransferase-like n=1 Tax=Tasmannia lanceolata TaxID=3420 RepID=UPI0040648FA2